MPETDSLTQKRGKVLFISHSSDFSGAERVLCIIVNGFLSGYEVHVSLPGEGTMTGKLAKNPGITLHLLALPVFSKNLFRLMGSIPRFVRLFQDLKTILSEVRPAVVYCNTIRNYITCAYAAKMGYPVILHLHEKNAGWHVGRLIAGIIARYAEKVVYVSEYVRNTYERFSPALSKKGTVVHNSIVLEDNAKLPALSLDATIEDRFPVIATAASLAPHKRLPDLISAMKTITKDFPRAILLVAGDGPQREDLLAQITSCGLDDHVRLTGYLENVPRLFAHADIIVCPFEEEGFGLVALEAMAQKKPVIAAASGAFPEIIEDGVTGMLYKPGDISLLAERITMLARSSDDRALLGRQGFERLQSRFDQQRQLARIRDIVHDVVAAAERK